jgi:hypothetical protein
MTCSETNRVLEQVYGLAVYEKRDITYGVAVVREGGESGAL